MAISVVPLQVYGAQPGIGSAVLATVPALKRWMSVQVILANTTALPATVTLGKNGSAAANQFVPAVSIPGNTTETLDLGTGLVLSAGDTIQGLQGTAAAITVFIGVISEDV